MLNNVLQYCSRLSFSLLFICTLLLSGVFPGSAQGGKQCPAGMAAYWNFNEESSGSYEDSVGGYEGKCAGECPKYRRKGKVKGAQGFNRKSRTGINVAGKAFNWKNDDSFSIEVWMKKSGSCSDATIYANEVLVGRDHPSDSLKWWVGIDCTIFPGKGLPVFALRDNDKNDYSVIGSRDLTDNKWHHLVAVRDANTEKIVLYVDGKLAQEKPATYTGNFAGGKAPINIGWLRNSSEKQHTYNYTGIIDEVAIYNSAISEKDILNHYYLSRAYCSGCAEKVNIMPLGDSITTGSSSGRDYPEPNEDDPGNWISYRRDLWYALTSNGYNIDVVGTSKSGQDVRPVFDGNHEGHSGYSTAEILNGTTTNPSGIDDWLAKLKAAKHRPDVVLLHIGTNDVSKMAAEGDIDSAIGRLRSIMKKIYKFNRNMTIVLAKIIRHSCDPSSTTYEACVESNSLTSKFNSAIETMAESQILKGDKIIVVDMEIGAGIDYSRQEKGGDMYDELHPWETGGAKMAAVWYKALAKFLPVCKSDAPIITSADKTEVYVNQELNYTVMASGHPAPTYSLKGEPADMRIDSYTGKISWVPKDIGYLSLGMVASNSEGNDEQELEVYVNQAPICNEGLISHWKLDEGQEGTYEDSVGTLDASCLGECPVSVEGMVGGAQGFDGSLKGLTVSADTSLDWSVSSSFTIEYWMKKTPNTDCNGNEVVVGRDDAEAPSQAKLHWWTGCNESGTAAFQLRERTGVYQYLSGISPILDGEWHHVVAVRDASIGQNRLYVDGALESHAKIDYRAGFDSESAALSIGHLNGAYNFSGEIDEVALYGRALDKSEIKEHSDRGKLGYCDLSPTIYQHPLSSTVAIGETASFTVVAGGSSELKYQWQRNGGNIKGAKSATYTTPPTVSSDNKTRYRCLVTNEYGLKNMSKSARLFVKVPPVITRQPVSKTVEPGSTATFTVRASGSKPLEYQWRRDRVDIDGATTASYTTPDVTVEDDGSKYRCLVKNAYGDKVLSDIATLKVKMPSTTERLASE